MYVRAGFEKRCAIGRRGAPLLLPLPPLLLLVALLLVAAAGNVAAIELRGVGEPSRGPEDIVFCHACAAIASEFCAEGMRHQEYLEEKFHVERKRAADLEQELLQGKRAADDTQPTPGTKYDTAERVLDELGVEVCDDFRMMRYDYMRTAIEAGDRRLTRACERFARDHHAMLIEFFARFYLMEISCVRGVDLFCNDYVDVCRPFDMTMVRLPSGTNAAVYVAPGSQPKEELQIDEGSRHRVSSHGRFIINTQAVAEQQQHQQRETALRQKLEREELVRATHSGDAPPPDLEQPPRRRDDHDDAAGGGEGPNGTAPPKKRLLALPNEVEASMLSDEELAARRAEPRLVPGGDANTEDRLGVGGDAEGDDFDDF